MSEDLHATRRRSLDASGADRFWDVRARIERMLDPPGAYTSERARAMITIQVASESTTIEKIAARNEKHSVRRLSITAAATGAAISACGSLGIPRSVPARRTEMRPVVPSNMAAYDGPSLDPRQCGSERISAVPWRLALLFGHRRLENPHHRRCVRE